MSNSTQTLHQEQEQYWVSYQPAMQQLGLSTHANGAARRRAKYPSCFREAANGELLICTDLVAALRCYQKVLAKLEVLSNS